MQDVLVFGGGISGLALAWKAASSGRRVLVLESRQRVGGCVHSQQVDDGFWFEMGAHTVYNSYGGLLDIVEGVGAVDRMVQRSPARKSFGLLRHGEITWLTPPKVLLQLNWLEAALRFPFGFFRSKDGQTVASYYSGLVGPGNFSNVLSPFFAAVPSQSADDFPLQGPGSLFKKRPRREDHPRSFGFHGGLQTVCDAVAQMDGVTLETGVEVTAVARDDGGVRATTADGRTFEAAVGALATPPDVAARLVREDLPALANAIDRFETVEVDSLGVVLPRTACSMPECAFVVPVDDLFFSAVTRDPFPDPDRRGFAFHFRPGVSRADKLARMAEVLRVEEADFGEVFEQHLTLPVPALGQDEIVEAIDAAIAGSPLAVTGNYFDGLAIEDCVQRSFDEWSRVGG
jgi:protoporphyrinogen/coproporphyrinogen III oxidase